MTLPVQIPTVDPAIVADIRRASQSAHVDFDYMMAEARQESSFQPAAKAATSSATGLYQFIDTTWLRAVKAWGAKHGLSGEADAITLRADGGAAVSDPATRQRILDLRRDPAISADLAADLAADNRQQVEHDLGRPASATDLYLAHFLGAHGASSFVREIEKNGDTKAAPLMPDAAEANRGVFFDAAGHPKTVAQIYQAFATRIEGWVRPADTAPTEEPAAQNLSLTETALAKTSTLTLLAMMNMLTETALKLVGGARSPHSSDHDDTRSDPLRRLTDTSV